jgi:hypothetical protein
VINEKENLKGGGLYKGIRMTEKCANIIVASLSFTLLLFIAAAILLSI